MSLQNFSRLLRLQLTPQQPMQQAQHCWGNSSRLAAARRLSGGSSGARKAEQMTDEELKAALPSMLFTTSNLIWSTTLAVGVAAAGLLCMFQVGSWIAGAAQSLRHLEQPTPPAPPPKSLAELIQERKAELQQHLSELEQLPRTTEVRQAIAAAKKELRQFRSPGESSWWWW